MGPPEDLVLLLKREYNLNIFVETGTYLGSTTVWAAKHFEKVFTIEYSKSIYEDTTARYSDIANINFIYGDSRSVLPPLVPQLETPAVFWLDGHWCGQQSYGETDQCPLIEELHVILQSPLPHILLIDDARLFLAPPPLPNRIDDWPSIDVVLRTLHSSNKKYYIAICEDVIIAVPLEAKAVVANYCQKITTIAWQHYGDQLKYAQQSYMQRGMKQIVGGVRIVLSGIGQRLENLSRVGNPKP
jgi:hypothetical protein